MDELRDAKQRVALAESVMKLSYIKATRNASVGQERFVARDDVITVIHEYAKRCREDASAEPAREQPVPAEGAQTRRLVTKEMMQAARSLIGPASTNPHFDWWEWYAKQAHEINKMLTAAIPPATAAPWVAETAASIGLVSSPPVTAAPAERVEKVVKIIEGLSGIADGKTVDDVSSLTVADVHYIIGKIRELTGQVDVKSNSEAK